MESQFAGTAVGFPIGHKPIKSSRLVYRQHWSRFLITVSFFVFTIIVARLGTEALAAHRIAMNAMSLSFLPGIGFGLAATTLVGQSIGAQRPADAAAAGEIAMRWANCLDVIIGGALFLCRCTNNAAFLQ